MGVTPWLTKGSLATCAAENQGRDSGADFSRYPRGSSLTSAAPRTIGGLHAGVPCLNSSTTKCPLAHARKRSKGDRTLGWPNSGISRLSGDIMRPACRVVKKFLDQRSVAHDMSG